MASELKSCILRVVESFLPSNFSVTTQQYESVESFVSGSDTFVSLPTGHGKSLIYQLIIPVVKELARHGWEKFQQNELILFLLLKDSILRPHALQTRLETTFRLRERCKSAWSSSKRPRLLDKLYVAFAPNRSTWQHKHFESFPFASWFTLTASFKGVFGELKSFSFAIFVGVFTEVICCYSD